jgi:alpha-2-macroglobulin
MLNRKQIFFVTFVLTIASTFFIQGCKSKKDTEIDPAFSEFVSAYTTGYLSRETNIIIVLSQDVEADVEPGQVIKKELFSFSPKVTGNAFWIDKRTIEFRSENGFASGKEYKGKFFLSKLVDVPKKLETFEFSFNIIHQTFEVNVDGMKTIDKEKLRWQQLSGTVYTADAADQGNIAKTVSATQNDKNLNIKWSPSVNKNEFYFVVDSIERTKKEGKITLFWDGKAIDVKNSGSEEIVIPSVDNFTVLDIKVSNEPEQVAIIQFSDPVMGSQNLDGLIQIDGFHAIRLMSQDNEIRVYPASRISGTRSITVESSVKNILGYSLKKTYSKELTFEETKPAVRLLGKGVILPSSSEGFVFPFEAVNLRAVDVKIVRIFEDNILQFMQVNQLDGERELSRVGKIVLKKRITLSNNIKDLKKWNTYSLDLNKLIKTEPGAIYKISIRYKKEYSTYNCGVETEELQELTSTYLDDSDDEDAVDGSRYDYYYYDYDDYYDYEDYNYSERNNPCEESYFNNNRTVSRNVLASDLGLIAKRNADGNMLFFVTDLKSAKPMANTELEIYDYQSRIMTTASTDENGKALVIFEKKPYILVAKNGSQRGYLRLDDGSSLSVSMFDVSGEVIQKGLKGFIYGERGVWRPGDTIFLSFILDKTNERIPSRHPVVLELFDPQGQIVKKKVKTKGLNGFYDFALVTDSDAPTGNWRAKVTVGGAVFSKTIKIETIMPNRLKIKLDFGTDRLSSSKGTSAEMEVKWLHGAIAKNLKAKVEVLLSSNKTSFKGYEGYVFDDPGKSYQSESQDIFEGRINEQGKATISPGLDVGREAPGMLKASFNVRVFEEGGNASIDRFSMLYSPFNNYVGMQVPKGSGYYNQLFTDTNHVIKIVTLDEDGKPVSKNNIQVKVYKLNWRWWWSSRSNDLANYVGNTHYEPVYSKTIATKNGKGNFLLRINNPEWGRYFVHVTDEESGHSTGQTVYLDWPAWAGSSPKGNEGAALLTFTSDKEKYKVGDQAKIIIPSGEAGRALVSVESGTKVLQTFWVNTEKDKTEVSFEVTPEMAPNVYVNVTLVQPHAQTKNDLPIRLYGIIPIQVEDPNTHLRPVIKTAKVWKPESKASVTISEENGKAMTYTLAVVDDGLLDLTRFATPNPWPVFYAREALGVKSWDLFDMVMGAHGIQLDKIIALGGDGEVVNKGGKKAERFKPMVKYIGPFYLAKGKTQTHEIIIPQYIGSVRIMVVAGQDGAYGKEDKTVPVRKPLMVLGTLPRVIGPGEEFELPVTVFAMEKHVKDVKVQVIPNDILSIEDNKTKTMAFHEVGDEVVHFNVKVKDRLGIGKIKIVATSGSEMAVYEVEIDVRNPNPRIVDVIENTIEGEGTWNKSFEQVGMAGTNKAVLELSNIPPINLGERLRYLVTFPHGCVEQTTSAAFPQLYLSDIMDLNDAYKKTIERNMIGGIQKLANFQNSSGGLSYWSGNSGADDWGTSYAGHFMLEAAAKGYALPSGFLDNWKRYQKQAAQSWSYNKERYYTNDLTQAYRLYTLALANAPELGAMNRMKQIPNLSDAAKWRLAASFALAGQPEVAKNLIKDVSIYISPYNEMAYSYGSSYRDEAMILETLILIGDQNKATKLVKNISNALNSRNWMSTQTTAYCLIAVCKYAKQGGSSNAMNFEYSNKGKNITHVSKMPIMQIEIPVKGTEQGNIKLKNNSKGVLFARIILEGIPLTGDQTAIDNNLILNVRYTSMNGTILDPEKLEQGTDFIAEVTLKNPSISSYYQQMALTQIFPSGWEIQNMRITDSETAVKSDPYDYQDIRDDRVYTYFSLLYGKSKTFRVVLNAAYCGKFYLPSVYCEAMYDNTINSRKPGKWVTVVKSPITQVSN